MNNLIVSLFALMDNSAILAGVPRGEEAFTRLVRTVTAAKGPTRVFLSFSNVDVATASFLRESALNFRTFCRGIRKDLYPVVANANRDITDELAAFLDLKGDAIVSCGLNDDGSTFDVRLLGRLEEKQKVALRAVIDAGEADARTLAKKYQDAEPTAWNNRLASLVAKGILVELRTGRAKSYKPVLEM